LTISSEDGIVSYTEKTKEVVMKKYKNWGIDMDGLSMTDPERYRRLITFLLIRV